MHFWRPKPEFLHFLCDAAGNMTSILYLRHYPATLTPPQQRAFFARFVDYERLWCRPATFRSLFQNAYGTSTHRILTAMIHLAKAFQTEETASRQKQRMFPHTPPAEVETYSALKHHTVAAIHALEALVDNAHPSNRARCRHMLQLEPIAFWETYWLWACRPSAAPVLDALTPLAPPDWTVLLEAYAHMLPNATAEQRFHQLRQRLHPPGHSLRP